MGKQICFFATAVDFHQLLDLIYNRGSYIIDQSGNKVSFEDAISNISEAYKTGRVLSHYYIVKDSWKIVYWDSGHVNQLVSEAIELSICHRISEKTVDLWPVEKYFQKGGYTVISNSEESDKFHEMYEEYMENPIYIPNPMYIENGYEHGRLWYPTSFYDKSGKTVLQSKEVTKEYNALARAIKKISILSDDKFAYILPDALEGFKNNTFIPRSGKYTIKFSKGE